MYDLAYRHAVSEQRNIAKGYPEVANIFERWLASQQTESKYLVIAK